MANMNYNFDVIGIVRSPYREKFGTPRQPGIVTAAHAYVELIPPYDKPEALKGIEGFSHLWLIFVFHHNRDKAWTPTVRPPRLGGNERIGVFASRAPYRPNPVGLSVVRFTGVVQQDDKLLLEIEGADLVDGTPVIDIKPYIPYADSIADAKGGYADTAPAEQLEVSFSQQALSQIAQYESQYPGIQLFIEQVLGQDPRPAYKASSDETARYGMRLLDFDVQWQVEGQKVTVLALDKVQP